MRESCLRESERTFQDMKTLWHWQRP